FLESIRNHWDTPAIDFDPIRAGDRHACPVRAPAQLSAPMQRAQIWALVGILLGTQAAAAEGDGAAPATAPDPAASRTLAGHHFLPWSLLNDPFTDTYFSSMFGAGSVSGDGPGFTVSRNGLDVTVQRNGRINLRLAAINQTFAFQVAILPWWAV